MQTSALPDYAASRTFLCQPGPLSVADIAHHAAILMHSPDPSDRLIGRTLTCPTAASLRTAAAGRTNLERMTNA